MKFSSEQFENRTMRRIYGIWFMRRVLPIFIVETIVLASLITSIRTYMSFADIVENLSSRIKGYSFESFMSVARYGLETFNQTEWLAIVLFVGGLFVGVLFARDSFRVAKNIKITGNFFKFSRVI